MASGGLLGMAVLIMAGFRHLVPDAPHRPADRVRRWPKPRLSRRGSASAGASLLDASGYIVARRRATVSSKVTGKVVKVMLEEGQRVEAGEIIALLDDSNWKAALAQSNAQLQQAEANRRVRADGLR